MGFSGCVQWQCLSIDWVLTHNLQTGLVRSPYRLIRPLASPHVLEGRLKMVARNERVLRFVVPARNERVYALMVRPSAPQGTSDEC